MDEPATKRRKHGPARGIEERTKSTGVEGDSSDRTAEGEDELFEDASLKNAFSTLMAKKPVSRTVAADAADRSSIRGGLGAYLIEPGSHDKKRVINYDDEFVFVYDMYPKATIHTLLLPRDPRYTLEQPLETLSDNPDFLASVQKKAEQLKVLVASELKRRLGHYSKLEQKRQEAEERLEEKAMEDDSFDPDSPGARVSLPPGRDWLSSIKIGVHSRPSMNHLHIHILSEDMHSDWVKKRLHYNSFNTSFFVDLDEFPLDKRDPRRVGVGSTNALLEADFRCWRCGKGFGNRYKRLKEHLEEEFEAWKRL